MLSSQPLSIEDSS
ncbi:hypothetical protein [Plasmodium yoelii yoelii]|uniref:Uncharacterized protein n=1 Tax=Plasmodium yoelii yoelii TaxID=73239 RepID=Q7RSC5_PLAYO|nr:hypothetical protein [Plasmodium yoelii yoelii]